MQLAERVSLHPDTTVGWHFLPSEEKERVQKALEMLSALPLERWPKDVAEHLPTPEPLYVLQAVGGKLYISFRRDADGSLTVIDMTPRDLIERHYLKRTNGIPA